MIRRNHVMGKLVLKHSFYAVFVLCFRVAPIYSQSGSSRPDPIFSRRIGYCDLVLRRLQEFKNLDGTQIVDSDYKAQKQKTAEWLAFHLLMEEGRRQLESLQAKEYGSASDIIDDFETIFKNHAVPGRELELHSILHKLRSSENLSFVDDPSVNPWINHPFLGPLIESDLVIASLFLRSPSSALTEISASAASLRPRNLPVEYYSFDSILFHSSVVDLMLRNSELEKKIEKDLVRAVVSLGPSAVEQLTKKIEIREFFPQDRGELLDHLTVLYLMALAAPQFFLSLNKAAFNTQLQTYVLETLNHRDPEIRQFAAMILLRLAESFPLQQVSPFLVALRAGDREKALSAKEKEQKSKDPLLGMDETIREYLNFLSEEMERLDLSSTEGKFHKGSLLLLAVVYKRSLEAARLSDEVISERMLITHLVVSPEQVDDMEKTIIHHMYDQLLGYLQEDEH
jgi:hypothetical protein